MNQGLQGRSSGTIDVSEEGRPPRRSHDSIDEGGRIGARVSYVLPFLTWALVVLAAYLVSQLIPLTYSAQSQAIAGGTSVSAAAVPSFAEAGQSLAQTYSRVFSGDGVQNRLRRVGALSQGVRVTASPVPETSVVLIEAEAPTEAAALKAAHQGVLALTQQVSTMLSNAAALAAARKQVSDAYQTLAEAQQKQKSVADSARSTTAQKVDSVAAVGAARSQVDTAESYLQAEVNQSGQANGLAVLRSGEPKGSNVLTVSAATVGIGIIAGLLLVILVHRRSWLRTVFRPRQSWFDNAGTVEI